MRILIVDDHEIFLTALKILLESNPMIHHVTILSDPNKIESELARINYNLILLDIQLEKVSGLKVGREIKSKYPTIPLVFLSGFDFEEYRYQAKKMNAQGFLLKGISYTELISVIRDVVIKGSKYTIDGKRVLTDSEKNILQFVSRGFTQESIATELSISKRTVSTHLQSIYRKMSVNSSAEALFKGIKLGIISKYD